MNSIAAYYDSLADKYGATHQSVDASSQEALDVRYRVLSEVADPRGKMVLDVGCGFGAVGSYIGDRDINNYVGIDISPKLIELAKTKHRHLRFECADLMDWNEPADIILSQGILYKADYTKIEAIVDKLYSLTNEALAFTTIYMKHPHKMGEYKDGEFRPNIHWLLDHCQGLTDKVVIRADYWKGDCCIYMYR